MFVGQDGWFRRGGEDGWMGEIAVWKLTSTEGGWVGFGKVEVEGFAI